MAQEASKIMEGRTMQQVTRQQVEAAERRASTLYHKYDRNGAVSSGWSQERRRQLERMTKTKNGGTQ